MIRYGTIQTMIHLSVSGSTCLNLSQCGIIFLSTPLKGSTSADWNGFVASLAKVTIGVRESLVNYLKTFDPTMAWGQTNFTKLKPSPKYRCFVETRATKGPGGYHAFVSF